MSLGPIPRSSILNYAAEHGLLGDAAEHFENIIRDIDSEYLSMLNAKPEPEQAALVKATDIEGSKRVIERMKLRAASATKRHSK